MRTTFEGPAILPGYAYRLRLVAEHALFPEAARFVAQIRVSPSSNAVLAEISSTAGGFEHISDTELELALTPTETAALPLGRVILDLVRTDLTPPLHLGVFLELPVIQPVTREVIP